MIKLSAMEQAIYLTNMPEKTQPAQPMKILERVYCVEENTYRTTARKNKYLWIIIKGLLFYNHVTGNYEKKKEIFCVCIEYQDAQDLCKLKNSCSIQNTYWVDSVMEQNVQMEDFVGKPIIKNLREGVTMKHKYLYAVVSKSNSHGGKDCIDFFYTNCYWAQECSRICYGESNEVFVIRIETIDIPSNYFRKVPINKLWR